eukprot:scaffold6238_cov106-Cylindrotheca_fusiformis.AAC.3
MLCHKLPKSIYFRRGAMATAMEDFNEFRRACIITDRQQYQYSSPSHIQELIGLLSDKNIDYHVFFEAEDTTLTTIRKGAQVMANFGPDVIIAIGGGPSMDAAKMMWVLYENPEMDIQQLTTSPAFQDIRHHQTNQRKLLFAKLNQKAKLVCIPAEFGSGSEVTPFAVVTMPNDKNNNNNNNTGFKKYLVADYALTPAMAIIDPNLVLHMSKEKIANGGMNAITQALEAYVSVVANEFSDGQALQALKLLKTYLPRAYQGNGDDTVALEKVHYASTLAGIAIANSYLGICHSLANVVGEEFHHHIPDDGIVKAILLPHVIKFNSANKTQEAEAAEDRHSKDRYEEIAQHLKLVVGGGPDRFMALLNWLDELKQTLGVPMSLQACGVKEGKFMATVDRLAADACQDPCSLTNPRKAEATELRQILLDAFYGGK